MTRSRLVALLLLLGLALALWRLPAGPASTQAGASTPSPLGLTLLLPDGADPQDVRVQAWQDTAAELGYPLRLASASQLLHDRTAPAQLALVLPDGLHPRMNDALLAHLQRLVRAGARLMLVYDAGMADMNGHYHPQRSRLSDLAGVRYALYGSLGDAMQREQEPWLDIDALPLLAPPPGKLLREHDNRPLTRAQPQPQPGEDLALASYKYGRLRYPVFATEGLYDGQRLMHGDQDNVLAGVRREGLGAVLFVNLPLGYLKLRTDGLPLHSFMAFFGRHVAQLPQLSPMADAQGAVILNWHIDAGAALPALDTLRRLGTFEQGPYSVHFTAGPDLDEEGDGGGMDLAHNPALRAWVRQLADQGHEVGSHGGWIHNAFGARVSTQDPALSAALIQRNMDVLRQASGRAVREYSAPTGNHPAWVTSWLHAQGVKAYYFTGDIGMAPTRSYQGGVRGPQDSWAYPVLNYGPHATFEEASLTRVAEDEVAAWLNDLSDYCADQRTTRLVYFHPPGITMYPRAFAQWLSHTGALVRQGRLRWTTMAEQTSFANRRLQARWDLQAQGPQLTLQARHPQSLQHLAWRVPVGRFDTPQVLAGDAQVQQQGDAWFIRAGDGRELRVLLPMRDPAPFEGALARAQRRAPLALRLTTAPDDGRDAP